MLENTSTFATNIVLDVMKVLQIKIIWEQYSKTYEMKKVTHIVFTHIFYDIPRHSKYLKKKEGKKILLKKTLIKNYAAVYISVKSRA